MPRSKMCDEVVPRLLCVLTFFVLTSYSLQWAEVRWFVSSHGGSVRSEAISGIAVLVDGLDRYFVYANDRTNPVRLWHGIITWSPTLFFWTGMTLAFLNHWRWAAMASAAALILGALWMVDFQPWSFRSFQYGYYCWLACVWILACVTSAMTMRRASERKPDLESDHQPMNRQRFRR